MYSFLIFISSVTLCASLNGPCPKKRAVPNFNFTAYATGVWYEIARSHNEMENKADCVIIKATQIEHGAEIEVSEVIDNQLIISDGIVFHDPKESDLGKLTYIVQGYQINVTFLGIDYEKFAVKHSCVYNETDNSAREIIWVLSRTQSIEKEILEEIEKLIVSMGMSDEELFWDHYTDESCNFKSLEIVNTLSDRLLKRIT